MFFFSIHASMKPASAMVENTANRFEKVTFLDHFEPNVQRKAGSMILCKWDDDDDDRQIWEWT